MDDFFQGVGPGLYPVPGPAREVSAAELRARARHEAREAREGSSNRIRNKLFDWLTDKGLDPETTTPLLAGFEALPVLGDLSGAEETYQAGKAGNWRQAAALGAATAIGIVPGIGDVTGKALKETAQALPSGQLRAAARSGAEVAPVFRGLADLPTVREGFHADMLRGKQAQGPWGAAVDVRAAPEDYAGERMFSTTSGSRFSVSPGGEINSVVKQVDEPNKALAEEALTTAKRHGGRWLSVFDTKIAEKYAKAGFRPVKRMKFADEYAPEGWDYDKFDEFNKGRPDVVFMEYDPDYKGGYSAGDTSVGDYTDDYDTATTELAARTAAAEDPLTLGQRVLGRRAEHLELPVKERPKADPAYLQMGTNPQGYARGLPEQRTVATPRLPEGAKYPQRDRIRPLIDKQEAIAQKLAERMVAHKGGPAQFFYHSGPVVEAAERAGMAPQEARSAFEQFADYYAATSPRTKTEDNLRNAALARWKEARGIPLTETVGPVKTDPTGKPLLSEKGYPMMLGEGGIHALRLGELAGGGPGPSMLTNPKPFTFAENVKGNLQGVTADTHAIRGALSALNEIEPGSIPDEWILPKYREAYKKDPTSLNPANMIDDKLKVISHKGVDLQPEYGVMSDIYSRAAEIAGVSPAEAQSMGWFGSGAETGLGSELKTFSELLDERVAVTAKELDMEPEEVLVKTLRGQMPLLGIGGGVGMLGLINRMGEEDRRKGGT